MYKDHRAVKWRVILWVKMKRGAGSLAADLICLLDNSKEVQGLHGRGLRLGQSGPKFPRTSYNWLCKVLWTRLKPYDACYMSLRSGCRPVRFASFVRDTLNQHLFLDSFLTAHGVAEPPSFVRDDWWMASVWGVIYVSLSYSILVTSKVNPSSLLFSISAVYQATSWPSLTSVPVHKFL